MKNGKIREKPLNINRNVDENYIKNNSNSSDNERQLMGGLFRQDNILIQFRSCILLVLIFFRSPLKIFFLFYNCNLFYCSYCCWFRFTLWIRLPRLILTQHLIQMKNSITTTAASAKSKNKYCDDNYQPDYYRCHYHYNYCYYNYIYKIMKLL